jgi:hypothetical protein
VRHGLRPGGAPGRGLPGLTGWHTAPCGSRARCSGTGEALRASIPRRPTERRRSNGGKRTSVRRKPTAPPAGSVERCRRYTWRARMAPRRCPSEPRAPASPPEGPVAVMSRRRRASARRRLGIAPPRSDDGHRRKGDRGHRRFGAGGPGLPDGGVPARAGSGTSWRHEVSFGSLRVADAAAGVERLAQRDERKVAAAPRCKRPDARPATSPDGSSVDAPPRCRLRPAAQRRGNRRGRETGVARSPSRGHGTSVPWARGEWTAASPEGAVAEHHSPPHGFGPRSAVVDAAEID